MMIDHRPSENFDDSQNEEHKDVSMIMRMMKRQDGQSDIGLVSITYFASHSLEASFRKCAY